MPDDRSTDIADTLKRLESRMDVLARPYEDALCNRVFDQSLARLQKFVAVLLIVAGVVGYRGWNEVLTQAKDKVPEIVASKLDASIKERLDPVIAKAEAQVEGVRLQAQANSNNLKVTDQKIQDQLTQIDDKAIIARKLLENRFQELLTQLNQQRSASGSEIKLTTQPAALTPIAEGPSGTQTTPNWAYYGQRKGGVWSDQGFNDTSNAHSDQPQVGDRAKVIVMTNVRSDKMAYDFKTGWRIAPSKGVALTVGTLVTVQEVESHPGTTPDSMHYWIRFDNPSIPLIPLD